MTQDALNSQTIGSESYELVDLSEFDLNSKQEAFIGEYLVDFNGKQAAIRAGYSERSAEQLASALLSKHKVRQALVCKMNSHSRQVGITAARVLQEITRLATFDPRKLYDADGNLKRICDLDDDTAACVGSIEVTAHLVGRRGEVADEEVFVQEVLKKVKVWDKNTALQNLGKYFKLFSDKLEITGAGGAPLNFQVEFVEAPPSER